MSSEEEFEKYPGNTSESLRESEKRSRVCYSRDFLLSFSELDICKKLPSGFDPSLLSEFEDGYHGPQDRLRNPGGLPLQSQRRTDYSSSPPTRGDSSNYSRGGVYGRWDNRPSVRSERDSDSQSDKDSDSGRPPYNGNPSRKPWQNSEHDGLLGSGTFARPPPPPGYSAPKGRPNDQYQLKKSNEPYQPPRPYKAGPLSRREMTDSLNDETFGSAECGNQDRAEEERRRRESFELMRKEQHKSLQEKQNSTTDKLKKDNPTNITDLVGESEIGNRAFEKLAEVDDSASHTVTNNDSSKSFLQNPVVRPLVPPGFKSTVIEKSSSTTSLASSRAPEAGRSDVEASISHPKTITQNGIFDNQEERHIGDNKLYGDSSIPLESEPQGIVKGNNIIDPSTQSKQPSILDKLFNSVVSETLGGSSGLGKKQDGKQDDPWNPPNVIQSSKFAQWFSEDENKGTAELSHIRPNDLFSLFGGSEKGASQASDVKPPRHISSDFLFPGPEIRDERLTSDTIPSSVEFPKHLNKSIKKETSPPVLTCEDLEQMILSGNSESSSISNESVQGQNFSGPEEPKAETDNRATQHLLSLLQKGPILKDTNLSPITDSGFSEKKVQNITQSGNSLTLETLFGSAFMKELQSAEAPVSVLGSTVNKNNTNGESSVDHRQQPKSDNFANWFGNYDNQVKSNSSKNQADISSKRGGFDGGIEFQLPEEESLIGVGDPVITRNSMFNSPFGDLFDRESQSSNRPVDIERNLMRGSRGSLDHDIPFHNLQAPSSPPRFNPGPKMMNHSRPFLHPLESHPSHASPPMNFNSSQEGMNINMINRGSLTNNNFPGNMMRPPFRQSSGGQAGFDPPHPMLQQMMQRPNTLSHHHHLQELNRGNIMSPHLRNHGPIQEHNTMQGFPFDQQQANFGGPGMGMQGPEVRGNHPEAFQRLLEMELRANSSSSRRSMHPFDSLANNNQGLQGHDLDAGFRYR